MVTIVRIASHQFAVTSRHVALVYQTLLVGGASHPENVQKVAWKVP
jgi:hypothetical protein